MTNSYRRLFDSIAPLKKEICSMGIPKQFKLTVAAMILAVFAGACSSGKPFLAVQYQLPPSSQSLAGEKVYVAITDTRKNSDFLSETAKKSLRGFNGTYSLVVLKEDGSGNLLGAYDLNALLSNIFQQKLSNMGIQIAAAQATADYELEILLKEFKLDLVKRKWVINMSYEANLLKNGNPQAMETVNGSAERLKVMGKSEAEKILSELLTDIVNKLDVDKLFQQARR